MKRELLVQARKKLSHVEDNLNYISESLKLAELIKADETYYYYIIQQNKAMFESLRVLTSDLSSLVNESSGYLIDLIEEIDLMEEEQ